MARNARLELTEKPSRTLSDVFEETVSNSSEKLAPKSTENPSIEEDVSNKNPHDHTSPNSNQSFNIDLGGGITLTPASPKPTDTDQTDPTTHPKVVDLATALSTAQSELATVMDRNDCLNGEVARLHTKCLQLENQASTGLHALFTSLLINKFRSWRSCVRAG